MLCLDRLKAGSVAIKADQKRSILQYIWDGITLGILAENMGVQVVEGPIDTLEQGLIIFQQFIGRDTQSGKVTTGSSGIGHSVTFAQWNVGRAFSPEELLGLAQELREVFRDTKRMLLANHLDASDPSIFDAMMADDRLQTVKRTQGDYTLLRTPWTR